MAVESQRVEDPDGALDRLWASFFTIRADVTGGRLHPGAVRAAFRALHTAAGRTGSDHVPVFRAEIRGEITRLKQAAVVGPPGPAAPGVAVGDPRPVVADHPGAG